MVWDRYEYDEKWPGTRYTEHVFLHSVGSVGHVVYSVAFEAQTIFDTQVGMVRSA
jgi:hypothetical protein